jgi:uncharacterized protein (DUF2249 family)/CRP-like cAMP-binding protein
MQSTGQTSTQLRSLTPMQGSVMTYAILSTILRHGGTRRDPDQRFPATKVDPIQHPDLQLDVRSLPPPERHRRIFALFASLHDGQALILISDHEPRPLRAEFNRVHGTQFVWMQRQLGDGRWEVRLCRPRAVGPDAAIEAGLLRSTVFSQANQNVLQELAHYSRRVAIKRHHCVAEQGVLWPYVGVVETGIVQAQLTTAAGREQAMYDVLPGDLFAETAFFDRGHMSLRHIALTADTVVLLLPTERLRDVAERDHTIRQRLEETAAQHTRATLGRFEAQLSLPTMLRVAQVLLPYAAPALGLTEALAPLPKMTQVELAASAGAGKEVVNRALAELEVLGAVRRDGGHVVKLDRAKLVDVIERE